MDILGIGNALLDIFYFSDDESALCLGLHPNHAVHVSAERLDELLLAVRDPILVSGGSTANAVKAAALLGADCAFVGCLGTEDRESDSWAKAFRQELEAFGVRCFVDNRNSPSGRCLVIRMPGNLKSIACAPGAAPSLTVGQIEAEVIRETKTVLLDGQTLRNAEVSARIAALCREHKTPLAIDVGSAELARTFAARLRGIILQTDALIFVNDATSLALAKALEDTVPGDRNMQSEEEFIDEIFSFYTDGDRNYPCIVETRGKNGAKAWRSGKTWIADPKTAKEHPLDDTGAGDVFAGSFLTASLRGLTMDRALDFANAAAALALDCPGTRLDREDFANLKTRLDS